MMGVYLLFTHIHLTYHPICETKKVCYDSLREDEREVRKYPKQPSSRILHNLEHPGDLAKTLLVRAKRPKKR